MASGVVRNEKNGQLHVTTDAKSVSRYVEYQNIFIIWLDSYCSPKNDISRKDQKCGGIFFKM